MKKRTGLLLGALLVTSLSFGQDNTTSKKDSYISLGPVAGIGHNWVSGMSNQRIKPAGYLGIGILYSKHEHWGVGGLLTASHEGFSQNVTHMGTEYTNTIDPTYLRVTPRAYYFFGDYGDNVRPKVYLGPSLGIKVAEDAYIDEPMPTGEAIYMRPDGEIFNTVDFGVNAGLGANIKLAKRTWLNLDADYYHGLTNATVFNNKSRGVRANVGILFGL